MVKNLIQKSKRGIAMIELIFALVIMGIVLMSAPMLIQQSINSGNVALQQEAIAAAASHTSMLLSLHWDENNTKYQAGVSPILATNTNLGNPFAGADGTHIAIPNKVAWKEANRAGFIHRINAFSPVLNFTGRNCLDANSTLVGAMTAIQPNSSEGIEDLNQTYDDVDDYNNKNVGLVVFNNEDAEAELGNYVDVNLTINTQVNYADDSITLMQSTDVTTGGGIENSATNSSNIKFITVTLTSNSGIAELDKNITIKAFSCNIGTTSPKDGGEKN